MACCERNTQQPGPRPTLVSWQRRSPPRRRVQPGPPEPWGQDIWVNLTPRFDTSRSGLGIHHCNPGSGCLCLPDRASLLALTAWMQQVDLQQLSVLN